LSWDSGAASSKVHESGRLGAVNKNRENHLMPNNKAAAIAIESAALRGARNFAEAIAIVEGIDWSTYPPEDRVPALVQAFYAACEAGMKDKARELARRIAADEPELPSIQPYLRP
jgi:hypothetical protein